ncbi:MAG TPA: polyhydroxyalkanoate synthesis repressor PhaR [Rhodobacteraceae bacterium]|nr:polyhydroxyalkanoate synthesis repressor PhaR [Paracoccaceae bacterium]
MVTEHASTSSPVIVKKYANRRLYNTSTSTYVTLEELAQMVRDKIEFTVIDAKSGNDLTRQVLTQIIFEEESKGQNLLPIKFLRQLIGFYGGGMQDMVPQFLEMSLDSFTSNQERLLQQLNSTFAGNPFDVLKDQAQQNMQLFSDAMQMFTGMATRTGGTSPEGSGPEPAAASSEDISSLKEQLQSMQEQIEKLAGQKK